MLLFPSERISARARGRMNAEAYRCKRVCDSFVDDCGDMGPQAGQQRRHHTARQRERGRADSGLVVEELLVWLVAGQAETRREVCDLLRGGTISTRSGCGRIHGHCERTLFRNAAFPVPSKNRHSRLPVGWAYAASGFTASASRWRGCSAASLLADSGPCMAGTSDLILSIACQCCFLRAWRRRKESH